LGGYGEYSIQELPDPIVARADIQGDLLIITGNAPGETKVVIKDSLNHVVEVPIFIDALTISPKIVSTTVGGIVDVTISGGNSPYTIETDPTAGVATATPITNNTQYGTATTRVTARGIGTTSMEVKDSSNPAKYAWITIKVNQ